MKTIILSIALAAIVAGCNQQSSPSLVTAAPAEPVKPPEAWTYTSYTDKMTGATRHLASSRSTNFVNLKFPYEGETHADLLISQGGALIHPDRGQYPCSSGSSESCEVLVKFDNEKAIYMFAMQGDDHNGQVSLGKDFVKKALKAEKVTIRLSAYGEGYADFEFYIQGLKPLEKDT